MATRKTKPDPNAAAAAAVLEVTGSERVRGEDLIGDPKLRKQFSLLKKLAETKKKKP